MTDNPTTFEHKGHPTIKLYDDRISIKAIDISTFRDFTFNKIKGLEFYRPGDNNLFGILFSMNRFWRKFRDTDNYVLRIKLNDGEHWDYETTHKFDRTFVEFIKTIKEKITIDK